MTVEALDLAQQFQTPVFVATDLDLGMNLWLTDPFDYPEKPLQRGKVLDAEDLERLGQFERYKRRRRRRRLLPDDPRHRAARWRPTSPAAPATTRSRATASGPRTGRRTSTAWR